MTTAPHLRSSVLHAKQQLSEGRARLKQRHDEGTPGIQISGALTDLVDSVIRNLFASALSDLRPGTPPGEVGEVALVANGGYGRRDLAPYSDVDLMLLHAPGCDDVEPLAQRILRDIFDSGMELGHSVRTAAQACQLARKDAQICTSLMEHRLVTGDQDLYERFTERFKHTTARRRGSLIGIIQRARDEERHQFGETVYLLRPNVKRSPGGLRDLQLLRWVGFASYGAQKLDHLQQLGALTGDDHRALVAAKAYLLRLRNEMHFHADKPYDLLDRKDQLRLAEWMGLTGEEGLLPVEQFMQQYFRHTSNVSNIATRFVAATRQKSRLQRWVAPLVSHQVEGDFLVGPASISATARGREKLHGNLPETLRLAELANLYGKRIDDTTLEIIRGGTAEMGDELAPQAAERFMSLLSQPGRLGELLRTLHSVGVLEKVLPVYRQLRCLLQFNAYHKFTVDEHCIRAVEEAANLQHDKGPLGVVYRRLKQKGILHLALLLHDAGKGQKDDHSDVGREIAKATAARFKLPQDQAQTLKFLVHKHLMMSHLAMRRDISDEQLLVKFARDVGTPERLRLLYVLTACDLLSVGPDVWNDWKSELLAELYHRTMQRLAGEDIDLTLGTTHERQRREILDCLDGDGEQDQWCRRQVDLLPTSYLGSTPPEHTAAALCELARLEPGQATASGCYLSESQTVEYTVGTFESVTPGVFHKLTGTLTSQGLEILSAGIHTLSHGLVLDSFVVKDPDFAQAPPAERIESINRALVEAVTDEASRPKFRQLWRPSSDRDEAELSPLPTRINVDNDSSDRYTVLDIFATDKTGLLYVISRKIFELGLSVTFAKIGTYLDQVVDVFYVVDENGEKVQDDKRLRQIRSGLLKAIKEYRASS